VSEVSCTIFDRVDPKAVAELSAKGREFWSYLCTGPKAPWITLFIDHPAVNLRLWLWMSYKFGLKGILVWEAMYWTSGNVFPADRPQNPWADPMSYTSGYGTAYGEVKCWGNGDGRFIYPPNRRVGADKEKYLSGPVNSVRWEILREGLEDYEYLWLLERAVKSAPEKHKALAGEGRKLLDLPAALFTSGREYTKDPRVILDYRKKIGEALAAFSAAR
jgi:Glycoside hydrolase 123, catalytic domain